MDILTKKTKINEISEKLRPILEDYNIKEAELIEKGAFIPDRELEIDENERTVVKYVSTISVDRDGDIIRPDGVILDDFRKNPIFLYAHKHGSDIFGGGNDTLPLGKDVWIKADNFGIKVKQKYAKHQLAEDIFQMHVDGFPLASSIGFIPIKYVINDGSKEWKEAAKNVIDKYGLKPKDVNSARVIYTKVYLLEHSDVPVPSNPDALALAYKSGNFKIKSFELKKDLELEKIMQEELKKKIEELEENTKLLEKELDKKEKMIEELNSFNKKETIEKLISSYTKRVSDYIDMKLGKV